jgi:hypothetical protein
MSNFADFKLSTKEKDDFFGFLLASETKTIRKTVTKVSGNDSIFEFSLSTAFSTSTATFTDSFSLNQSGEQAFNSSKYSTPATISISGLKWSPDGTKFYTCDVANSRINQYTCSTAFDISTASYTTTFPTYDKEIEPRDILFNTAGTTMIVLGSKGNYDQGIPAPNLVQYTLGSAFNISTATFTKRATVGTAGQYTQVKSIFANTTGLQIYIISDDNNLVNSYNLGTNFDVGTVTFLAAYDFSSTITSLSGGNLNAAGTKLYGINNATNRVFEYPLNTAFNLVSVQPTSANFNFRTNNINPRNITFNTDGTKMYIIADAGRFQIDSGEDEQPYSHLSKTRNTIRFYEGYTYIFDVSDTSLLDHNFSFSTTNDGTFGGGAAYTTNVTSSGTIGNAGATITIVVPANPDSPNAGSAIANLFYFDNKHSKLGGSIITNEYKSNFKINFTNFVDDIQTRERTALQEDKFLHSYILNAGTNFSVSNGDLIITIV